MGFIDSFSGMHSDNDDHGSWYLHYISPASLLVVSLHTLLRTTLAILVALDIRLTSS